MKADFSCVTRKVFPKEELQDVCSEHGSHCEFSICVYTLVGNPRSVMLDSWFCCFGGFCCLVVFCFVLCF